jgi:hypothetical protein
MKFRLVTLSVIVILIAGCDKNSGDANRIRALEDENARLRRAAGQNAALVPAAEKPPKEVLDEEVTTRHPADSPSSEGGRLRITDLHYTVTNNYTRQVQDETFHIYEFELKWTERYEPPNDWENRASEFGRSIIDYNLKQGPVHRTAREIVAFVKRGNTWRSRNWRPDE